MAMIKLYAPESTVAVRSGVTGTDAADWTPDDESSPDDYIFDGREWSHIHIFGSYVGSPTGETLSVQPIVAYPVGATEEGGSVGRHWRNLGSAITGLNNTAEAEVVTIDSHMIAFRVTTVTLGGATSVTLRATGGEKLLPHVV